MRQQSKTQRIFRASQSTSRNFKQETRGNKTERRWRCFVNHEVLGSIEVNMFGSTAVPFHHLEGLRLALYTPEETKKLSVIKLTNPETFDSLLHPNFGGLYDPALGPTDKDDLCGTCAQNYIYCPGHFGHLELPLPVYHPLFFKELLQILRSSCFKCGDLLFSNTVKHVFLW